LRAFLTWPFEPLDARLVLERFAPEDRLPLDDLRAPPDDLRAPPVEARLDAVRLLLEALRERALAPFVLEPPREDVERVPELPPLDEPPLLDEPRLLDEPLFCCDFEVASAILASLFESSGSGCRSCPIYESALPTRSTSSPS
jgi:hypothetical protein